jgi:hypothetical protein
MATLNKPRQISINQLNHQSSAASLFSLSNDPSQYDLLPPGIITLGQAAGTVFAK